MPASQGRINDLVVNADGKRLFVAVPDTTLFGPGSWVQGSRDQGWLHVINVDEDDRPTSANDPTPRSGVS
jgi:hypothetical protein